MRFLKPIVGDFDYARLESYAFHTSWHMNVPMLILAVTVVVLGIFPGALDWLIGPVQTLLFT